MASTEIPASATGCDSSMQTEGAQRGRRTFGSRTLRDAMTLGGTEKIPDAVDQLGLEILIGFRRKVFGVLILQALAVLGIAALVARIPFLVDRNFMVMSKRNTNSSEFYVDAGIFCAIVVLLFISIGLSAYFRYKFPANAICTSVFTVLIAIVVALLGGVNCFYGMALVVGCIVLIGAPSCVRYKDKVIEVFPVSVFVAFLTVPVGIVGWQFLAPQIHALWVITPILLNVVGMVWLGYEMDWICSRLNPDEWLLPVVLVWVEFLIVILITFLVATGANGNGGSSGGSAMCRCRCYHCFALYPSCNCWIYQDGSSSKTNYYENVDKFRAKDVAQEAAEAPRQENMTGDSV